MAEETRLNAELVQDLLAGWERLRGFGQSGESWLLSLAELSGVDASRIGFARRMRNAAAHPRPENPVKRDDLLRANTVIALVEHELGLLAALKPRLDLEFSSVDLGTIDYQSGYQRKRILMQVDGPADERIFVHKGERGIHAEAIGRRKFLIAVRSSKWDEAPVDGGPERHEGVVTVTFAGVETKVRVTWCVRIPSTLTALPQDLRFNDARVGSESVCRVRLVHHGEGQLDPQVRSRHRWIHTRVDGDELVVTVAPHSEGPFCGSIVVHSGEATARIRISGNTEPTWYSFPESPSAAPPWASPTPYASAAKSPSTERAPHPRTFIAVVVLIIFVVLLL